MAACCGVPAALARVGAIGQQSMSIVSAGKYNDQSTRDKWRAGETPDRHFRAGVGKNVPRPLLLSCCRIEAIQYAGGAERIDSSVGKCGSRAGPNATQVLLKPPCILTGPQF